MMGNRIILNGVEYEEIVKEKKSHISSKTGHTINKDNTIDPFDTMLTYTYGMGMGSVVENMYKEFNNSKFDKCDNYNLNEVELILQKKSKLPSAERKQIMIWFEKDYKEVEKC